MRSISLLLLPLLFSTLVIDAFAIENASSGNDKKITNSKVEAIVADTISCDTMEDRNKCAEDLITSYNKKHHLYSSIEYDEYAIQKFTQETVSSPDLLLEKAIPEAEEAKKHQGQQISELGILVQNASVEADIFSKQEYQGAKLKKNLERAVDANTLNLLTVTTKAKAKVLVLNGVLNESLNKKEVE